MVNHLKAAPSFNPRFVLGRGELLDLYDDLEVIDTNDDTDNQQSLSYLLAQRPAPPLEASSKPHMRLIN